MDNATLTFRFRKYRLYCFFNLGESVSTNNHDILNTSVPEVIKDAKPIFAALVLTNLQTDYILSTIECDLQNYISGRLLDSVVLSDGKNELHLCRVPDRFHPGVLPANLQYHVSIPAI